VNYMPTGLGRSDAESALVAAYASGALGREMHALVAGHLEMSDRNRALALGLEEMLGREIEQVAEAPAIRSRDARLQAIFATERAAPVQPRAVDSVFPPSVAALVGKPYEALSWRMVIPGVRESRVSSENGREVVLYRIKAGRKLPQHTHDGLEATLVLRGAFSDINGHYGAGDIAIADDEIDHRPIADPDEDCLCLAVTEGSLRLTGPVATLLRKITGRA
jgi:putative transcriptional regulator